MGKREPVEPHDDEKRNERDNQQALDDLAEVDPGGELQKPKTEPEERQRDRGDRER